MVTSKFIGSQYLGCYICLKSPYKARIHRVCAHIVFMKQMPFKGDVGTI